MKSENALKALKQSIGSKRMGPEEEKHGLVNIETSLMGAYFRSKEDIYKYLTEQ